MKQQRVKIIEAKPLTEFHVALKFNDGHEKEIDLLPFLNGQVFEPLKNDPALFRQISLEGGTLCWPTGADIDPYVLYYGSAEEAEKYIMKTSATLT
ncbi:MAG: DUF2442 domain-containing protein [Candidatus Hinthialibacter antarcticus]|nr:DUF2442 domain-containing protein [Candidatus Hinthialibacter antarcticus]